MDGKVNEYRSITMKKDKNLLIFTNVNFPYKISFDLNSGKYYKIMNGETKEIKNTKSFFANYYYSWIINQNDFPIYYQIIKMAAALGNSRITNMGTVLNLLKEHLFWEQYLVLNLPINNECAYPLTFYPKDVLEGIKRAIQLRQQIGREADGEYWRSSKYSLPPCFNLRISMMCEKGDIFFKAIRYINTFQDTDDFAERFSIIYSQLANFETLVKTYNYEYKNLIEYICFLKDYDGYVTLYDSMNDLIDYNQMSYKICEVCNRKNKYEKYPRFLKSRHMIIEKNYESLKNEYKEEFFQKAYNGDLEYSNGKYVILEPHFTKDILKEASEMHNCVASYIDKIIEGKTRIIFMREKKDEDKSLVTVEVKNGHIRQAYQINNTLITDEQRNFLEKYAKNKKLILDNV